MKKKNQLKKLILQLMILMPMRDLKTQLVTLLRTKLQILAQTLQKTLDLTKQMTQIAQNLEILHPMRQIWTLQITQVVIRTLQIIQATILVQNQMRQVQVDVVCKRATQQQTINLMMKPLLAVNQVLILVITPMMTPV